MPDELREPNGGKYELWNPTAAVNWSAFAFSPIFGAWVHSKNWKILGNEENAKKSMYWVYAGFAVLLTGGFLYLPYLISWYFVMARKQMKFVKNDLNNDYEKKSWKTPIKYGVAAFSCIFVAALVFSPDDSEMDLVGSQITEYSTSDLVGTWTIDIDGYLEFLSDSTGEELTPAEIALTKEMIGNEIDMNISFSSNRMSVSMSSFPGDTTSYEVLDSDGESMTLLTGTGSKVAVIFRNSYQIVIMFDGENPMVMKKR